MRRVIGYGLTWICSGIALEAYHAEDKQTAVAVTLIVAVYAIVDIAISIKNKD